MSNIVTQGNILWCSTFGYALCNYSTFAFLRSSIFHEPIYNYLIPDSSTAGFDWDAAEKIIHEESKLGWEVGYYVEIENEEFSKALLDRKYVNAGVEAYMQIPDVDDHLVDEQGFELVLQSSLEDYVQTTAECFPDWGSNSTFSRELFKSQQRKVGANYIYKKDGVIAGACGMLFSKSQNLGYLTNDCTLPKFRGQGIQQTMIGKRCQDLSRTGISRAYTIVEPDSTSYRNYLKSGFVEVARYSLYTSALGISDNSIA